jgi:hypothetical protein
MALSARSWPMSPVIGVSSSVVLKPSEEGLTTRRSSPGSSGCGRAATVVTSPLGRMGISAEEEPGCCERLKNMP